MVTVTVVQEWFGNFFFVAEKLQFQTSVSVSIFQPYVVESGHIFELCMYTYKGFALVRFG